MFLDKLFKANNTQLKEQKGFSTEESLRYLQKIVDTLNKVQSRSGRNVFEWYIEDLCEVLDCFSNLESTK